MQSLHAFLCIESLVECCLCRLTNVFALGRIHLGNELTLPNVLPFLYIDTIDGAHAGEADRRAAVLFHFAHIVFPDGGCAFADRLCGDFQWLYLIALLALSAVGQHHGGCKYGETVKFIHCVVCVRFLQRKVTTFCAHNI